jgi:2'-5' RNA ligase
MRAFIAVKLPELIMEEIAQFIGECRKHQTDGINYVPAANIHITLKFLGDIEDDDSTSISEELAKLDWKPTRIKTEGMGGFPGLAAARVLWIGLKSNPELVEIQSRIEEICREFGIPPEEKSFKPHLTIARIKGGISPKLLSFFKQNPRKTFGGFIPDGFHLFQSKLSPSGPAYKVIRSFTKGG